MKCECGGCVIRDGNDIICGVCGLVESQEPVDQRDPRVFDNQDWKNKATHSGAVTFTRSDKGLGSATPKQHKPILHLHPEHQSLTEALILMKTLCFRLRLPKDTIEYAAQLLHKIDGGKGGFGYASRKIPLTVAVVVFLASKERGAARSFPEVIRKAGVEKTASVKRLIKITRRKLDLPPVVVGPRAYVDSILAELQNLEDVVDEGGFRLNQELLSLDRAVSLGAKALIDACRIIPQGANPNAVAAAAVFTILNDEHPGRVSKASGISETSVMKYSDLLTPDGDL